MLLCFTLLLSAFECILTKKTSNSMRVNEEVQGVSDVLPTAVKTQLKRK